MGINWIAEFAPEIGRVFHRHKETVSRDIYPSYLPNIFHSGGGRSTDWATYGIGLRSVEEFGSFSSRLGPLPRNAAGPAPSNESRTDNGQPRLRDRLRQHQLDPTLVKRYAADLCGTQELREASRELIESFVVTLAQQAPRIVTHWLQAE